MPEGDPLRRHLRLVTESAPSPLAAQIEKLGVHNRVTDWILSLEGPDQSLLDAKVFNLGTVSVKDLRFVESEEALERILAGLQTVLSAAHAQKADEASTHGKKIAEEIYAAAA